jgi:indole-3-pyruvate monooxygenase
MPSEVSIAMGESVPVLIVGAGPSGLALSACLHRKGIAHVVLERADQVGSRWRSHYDRLHLHTVRGLSSLPYRSFDKGVPRFPSRQEVVDYLDAYASENGVAPIFGQDVRRATRVGDRWVVKTQDRSFEADTLVVATGYNRSAHAPRWPGQDEYEGEILHSRDYRNGSRWKGKHVLVVGAGNTGAELSVDLHEHGADPAICIRGPIHVVPREMNGLPTQVTGIVLSKLPLWVADRLARTVSMIAFGDLSAWGIERPSIGPISQIVEQGRIPIIDVGAIDLIRRGLVRVVPGIERFTKTGVELVDGSVRSFDAVVLATGYRANIGEFLDDADQYLNERGYPKAIGPEAEPPDPYFIGYGNPPTGQLREIRQHAIAVADRIAASRARS